MLRLGRACLLYACLLATIGSPTVPAENSKFIVEVGVGGNSMAGSVRVPLMFGPIEVLVPGVPHLAVPATGGVLAFERNRP